MPRTIPPDSTLLKMTVAELRSLMKGRGVQGYSSKRKSALLIDLKDLRVQDESKPKNKETDYKSELDLKTVKDLRALAKKAGISIPSGTKKDGIIELLYKDSLSKSSKKKKISVEEKKEEQKAKEDSDEEEQKAKEDSDEEEDEVKLDSDEEEEKLDNDEEEEKPELLCLDKNNKVKCPPTEICDTTDGKCRKKRADGNPWGEAGLKSKYGKEYKYDKDHRLLGRFSTVMEHLNALGLYKEKEKPVKESKSCIKEENSCKEDEVCHGETGRCLPDSKSLRKNMYTLVLDDKNIVGDKETVERLQSNLGGSIVPPPLDDSSLKGCAKSDAKCPKDKICKLETGMCVADNTRNRKEQYVLTLDSGKKILGSLDALSALQKSLGGTILQGEKKDKSSSSIPEGDVEEIIREEKPSTVKKSKESKPQHSKDSPKVKVTKEMIIEAFKKCIAEKDK